jgi:hypothetical protein
MVALMLRLGLFVNINLFLVEWGTLSKLSGSQSTTCRMTINDDRMLKSSTKTWYPSFCLK